MRLFLNLDAMKHLFAYKLTTLVLVILAIASVAARAQETLNDANAESAEEITNFDDIFAEETSTNESAPAEQSAAKSGSSGVTVLDEMGIEGEGINEVFRFHILQEALRPVQYQAPQHEAPRCSL